MLEPVKAAFGQFMGRFYAEIVPTTKPLESYAVRGLAKSIVWAPSRMVDLAEDMLASWQRNDTDNAATKPANMPVMIVAMARDYTPTGRDYTRQIADAEMVVIPGDVKERTFSLRTIAGDVRAQVAIFAQDEPTARSLAAQFLLFLDATPNRRFTARYVFAGQGMDWPVQIESPDSPAMSIQTESKNLAILAIDLTLKATLPLFSAPAAGQPNDGKGTPGDAADPSGYLLTVQVNHDSQEAP
ncbi:hypothetical protein BH10PSE16_BH10PSE16_00930 [soil metagenome]